MKRIYVIAALLTFTSASFGLDLPRFGRQATSINQRGTCDGSGKGARKGRQAGPRDGSGPIHTPGTGGGNQQRRAR